LLKDTNTFVWSDPFFNQDKEFTRREAWFWVKEYLESNEQLPSVRELANQFNWHRSKVDRFIFKLHSMGCVKKDINHVTEQKSRHLPNKKSEGGSHKSGLTETLTEQKSRHFAKQSDFDAQKLVEEKACIVLNNKSNIIESNNIKSNNIKSNINKSNNIKSNTSNNSLICSKKVQNENLALISFESFWKEYPRKVAKHKAKLAYMRALKRSKDSEAMLLGLRAYVAKCESDGTEDQFIQHASTWLNNNGWLDYDIDPNYNTMLDLHKSLASIQNRMQVACHSLYLKKQDLLDEEVSLDEASDVFRKAYYHDRSIILQSANQLIAFEEQHQGCLSSLLRTTEEEIRQVLKHHQEI